MARPRGRQEPRTTMSIRVSAHERKIIEEKAAELGMDVSAYVRTMAVNGGVIDPSVHEDRQRMMQEISKVGNNINQIARMANTNIYISNSEVQETKELLRVIQKLITESMKRQVA